MHKTPKRFFVKTLTIFIRVYQILISSWTRAHCRFQPTCSRYAIEALEAHGVAKGLYFTLKRLLRCHPFYPGGYDPIPKKEKR